MTGSNALPLRDFLSIPILNWSYLHSCMHRGNGGDNTRPGFSHIDSPRRPLESLPRSIFSLSNAHICPAVFVLKGFLLSTPLAATLVTNKPEAVHFMPWQETLPGGGSRRARQPKPFCGQPTSSGRPGLSLCTCNPVLSWKHLLVCTIKPPWDPSTFLLG